MTGSVEDSKLLPSPRAGQPVSYYYLPGTRNVFAIPILSGLTARTHACNAAQMMYWYYCPSVLNSGVSVTVQYRGDRSTISFERDLDRSNKAGRIGNEALDRPVDDQN